MAMSCAVRAQGENTCVLLFKPSLTATHTCPYMEHIGRKKKNRVYLWNKFSEEILFHLSDGMPVSL